MWRFLSGSALRRQEESAALDSAPNVAVRVLSIYPRYKQWGAKEYDRIFGPLMLDKAKRIEEALRDHPALVTSAEGGEWRVDWEYLAGAPALLAALAAIVQQPSPFEQVLTEELDEIDCARQMRREAEPCA